MSLAYLFLIFFFAFWICCEVKAIRFWLYLWQLKDYLWGRFADHFQTNQGMRALFSVPFFFKFALFAIAGIAYAYARGAFSLAGSLGAWSILILVCVWYALETVKNLRDFMRGSPKVPVWTIKARVLDGVSFFVIFVAGLFFIHAFSSLLLAVMALLALDLGTPILVSAVVLSLEPVAVFERKRLVRLATRKRQQFKNLAVVGITGSYGKTSVKEFLAHILSQKFNMLKTAEHRNSEVGIAKTILEELKQEHEVFVCEMGAYKKGGIKLLAGMAHPSIGIVTGINEQHMATFGSLQNIIDTKFELIEALPMQGIGIVNWDNQHIQKSKIKYQNDKSKLKIIRASTKEQTDIWAEDIKVEKEWVEFTARTREGESAGFRVNVLGKHNIQNILLAAGAAKELGMTLREIARACAAITPAIGAMKLKKGIGGSTIIDSSYSANPDGVVSDLEYLALWEGRKIIVMPCLIELGKASKEAHEKIGRKIAEVCDRAVITTKERFEDVKKGAVAGGMRQEHILFMEHAVHIMEQIGKTAEPGDAILVEGRVQKEIINSLVGA
ncbi:MAG: UDP-N-acetylmuramoyl-tripeptide--D-alanyl-D-alanine ligase [Candidatus Wildermuthbacteria bacterium]|nr:UDP-N-acetylmuramoyl-tripeptide--D-alanyl-D-alanine ligase [Candidatus Wildermuthbacteria bacterium]